jgi:DNA-directed RNA polymerase specialized sigma24 family protein
MTEPCVPPLTDALGPLSASSTPRRQRRLTPDQAAELVAEYQAGADLKELAARWGVHRTTVAGHLGRAGVELRRQGLSEDQVDEAVRLYGEGWSLQRLAERYDCDDETVRQRLKAAGVVLRRPWERV